MICSMYREEYLIPLDKTVEVTFDKITLVNSDGCAICSIQSSNPTISVSVNPANTAEPINSEEVIAFLNDRWEP